MLNIDHQLVIPYDLDLESLFAMLDDNIEYKAIIRMNQLLVNNGYNIQDSKVGASLDVGNNLQLQKQGVKVK